MSKVRAELGPLVTLAWPIAIAHLGLIAMSLVDTAVLGHVSTSQLAGAAMGRAIGFAAITIGMGVATGLEPLASQAIGANDPGRAWQGLRANLKAGLLLAVPNIVAAFATTFLLAPFGVADEITARVRDYLIGQTPSMVLTLAFISTKSFLQAHGSTAPALIGSLAANVLNLVVCNVLVRGDDLLVALGHAPIGLPRLGALGAGIALSIASLVLAACVLVPARKHRVASPGPPVPLRVVFRIGMPVGLQMLAEYGVFTLALLITGRLGAEVAAAHQIAVGLASFTYMGALGIAGATAVRVGLAVGAATEAQQVRRAGLVGVGLGAVFMSFGAVVFAVVPRPLVELFSDDPEVVAIGVQLLRIAAVFQLFDGVQVVAAGALRGAGDVRLPSIVIIGAHWLVGLPIALLLCFPAKLGAVGLWWGLTAGLVTAAGALTVRFVILSRRVIARV